MGPIIVHRPTAPFIAQTSNHSRQAKCMIMGKEVNILSAMRVAFLILTLARVIRIVEPANLAVQLSAGVVLPALNI